jgi:hypothetical protein
MFRYRFRLKLVIIIINYLISENQQQTRLPAGIHRHHGSSSGRRVPGLGVQQGWVIIYEVRFEQKLNKFGTQLVVLVTQII